MPSDFLRLAVIDRECHIDHLGAGHRAPHRLDVGEPARAIFEIVIGLDQHLRIHTESDYDGESALVLIIGAYPAEVDPTIRAGPDPVECCRDVVKGNFEITGEQIPRPLRNDAQKGFSARQGLCDRSDGAIAADSDNRAATSFYGLLRHSTARVVFAGLPIAHVVAQALGHCGTQRVLVDLRGIPDDAVRRRHVLSLSQQRGIRNELAGSAVEKMLEDPTGPSRRAEIVFFDIVRRTIRIPQQPTDRVEFVTFPWQDVTRLPGTNGVR